MKMYRDIAQECRLYQWFHQNTQVTGADLFGHRSQFPLHSPLKTYNYCDKISLPLSDEPAEMSLVESLMLRRSTRDFDAEIPMTLQQLSDVLFYSYGVTHRLGNFKFRAAASAGARYPIEVYLGVNNVAGLDPGLYHYDAENHVLDVIQVGPVTTRAWAPPGSGNDDILGQANCVLVFSAVFARTIDKYGDRGYRLIMLDAGHLAQNVYLMATANHLGCVAIGGLLEGVIEERLGLDGVTESVVYGAAVGSSSVRLLVR